MPAADHEGMLKFLVIGLVILAAAFLLIRALGRRPRTIQPREIGRDKPKLITMDDGAVTAEVGGQELEIDPALLEDMLAEAVEADEATDAVIAQSGEQTKALWRIREGISEAQVRAGKTIKHDIALPIGQLAAFMDDCERVIEAAYPGLNFLVFGHLGDGNLHYNLQRAPQMDDEDFYKIGDAMRFVDPADAARGLAFDGRVAEDFKTQSGTWVSAGSLRVSLIAACNPLIQDAVITGHDRSRWERLCGLIMRPCSLSVWMSPPSEHSFSLLSRRCVGAHRVGHRCPRACWCSICRHPSTRVKSPTRGLSISARCSTDERCRSSISMRAARVSSGPNNRTVVS